MTREKHEEEGGIDRANISTLTRSHTTLLNVIVLLVLCGLAAVQCGKLGKLLNELR